MTSPKDEELQGMAGALETLKGAGNLADFPDYMHRPNRR